MANPSKAIGTRAETMVKNYFNSHYLRCERKALAGSDDEGDLRLYLKIGSMETEVTVEVKAGKQTQNYPRSRMDEWKQQTIAESGNSDCIAMLVIVRYHRRLVDAEVWMPNWLWWGHSGWTMMYLNQFLEWATDQQVDEED